MSKLDKGQTVNYWQLLWLSRFGWLSNQELARLYREVNPNSETDVKAVIRSILLPNLMTSPYWPAIRERLHTNLRYFLTTSRFPAEEIYEAAEPAFDLPDDPTDYYRWAWDVLFGDEPWQLPSLEGYIEDNDRRKV